jgi:phage tail sheath protein FI
LSRDAEGNARAERLSTAASWLEARCPSGDDRSLSRPSDRWLLGARFRSSAARLSRRAVEVVPIDLPLSPPAPPIQAVQTSTAAFLGPTASGPHDTPVLVTSMVDYEQTFGMAGAADDTGVSVRLFLLNGGRRAYVVRTADVEASGLPSLASVDFVNLVSVPATTGMTAADAAATVDSVAAFCEERRAFYLVDAPSSLTSADVTTWKDELEPTANAALYFPGLQVDDPANPGQLRNVPPSGAVAGVIARTDIQRGVWAAPAGIANGAVQGARDVATPLPESESARLAAAGVCPLRRFSGQGIRVWGARTLASAQEPEWKYVSVRRLFLFVEDSIDHGTRWAVFEPNDERLWRSIRTSIEDFLFGLYQSGALVGRTPQDAYFVRCDRMTMTQDDIDNGRLVCLVGIAPVRPAEFVEFRTRWSLVP